MTVGIVLSNGEEAIAITDSRVSGSGRQSDSANKMCQFSGKNYKGVSFGTGNGDSIQGLFSDVRGSSPETLEQFLGEVHQKFRLRQDKVDAVYLASLREEIAKAAQLIVDPVDRKKAVDGKTREILGQWEKTKLDDGNGFLFSAYDNDAGKVRVFSMNGISYGESFMDHFEIGSGSDGANLYLSTRLQGLNVSKLSLEDLAFFALQAHATSTINRGVGGTPKIAVVSKEGAILGPDKTVALVNLSGAYLAEHAHTLKSTDVRQAIKGILENDIPNYKSVARKLGVDAKTLTNVCIPYSSWQEASNRISFNQTE
jgi:hypothetical protein